MWYLDQKANNFKKYRIPAHENPVFTRGDNLEALRQYGGEESDEYKQLILGEHGAPTVNIIPRDTMVLEPYDFFTYRYTQADKAQGWTYQKRLGLPAKKEDHTQFVVFAIDTGYADPTVIQVFGHDGSKWRLLTRYRITRIPFPEQAEIINWLDDYWKPAAIGVDAGAGGGGVALMQSLIASYPQLAKNYEARLVPVSFNAAIEGGKDQQGTPIKYMVKSWAGGQLAKMIGESELIFSEVDMEGVSQLERVAYTRKADGSMKFFVQSETGSGESSDDHIFASFIVFVTLLSFISIQKPKKRKLTSGKWMNQ